MAITQETLNKKLYRILSKYKPKPLDSNGKVTPMEDEADVFKFTFTQDGTDYGNVFATVDDQRNLILYYGNDVGESSQWLDFVVELKTWKNLNGFKGWQAKDTDQLQGDMARRTHMKKKDNLGEGYYPMGKKASYSDSIPSVKIVIEHSRVIEEGEQRYRNINRIFLENQLGERYLLDTKKPGIARVYARHIAEGGKVNDDRWSHIGSLCEEYTKMAGFVRATRNGQFNESAQQLVNEGLEHYQSLRESLSRMTGKRGYNAYFESWTPALMEDGTEENNLNELFVQETLDPRIESVMPILNRIHKKVSESTVDKEMNKLAEWADSLTEEESIKSNNPVGIPEEKLAEAEPVPGKYSGHFYDAILLSNGDYEVIKINSKKDDKGNTNPLKLQVGSVVPKGKAHSLQYVNDGGMFDETNRAERLAQFRAQQKGMKEDAVDESALQAYLGDKKYGRKGMNALRDAGRKHVSKEKMQKIRAKFSKKEKVEEDQLDDAQDKIRHLMQKYHWSRQEAIEHLYSDETDDSDLEGSRFEKAPIKETDMAQADSSLYRNNREQPNDKMDHFKALDKAAKMMGYAHFMDVPDDEVERHKVIVRKLRAGEEVDEGDVGAAIGKAVGTVAGAEFGPAGSMAGGAIGSSIGDKITGESTELVDLEPHLKGLKSEFDKLLKHGERMDTDPEFARKAEKHYAKYKTDDDLASDDMADDIDEGLAEDLDANQKRAGQLGPTEKVKNNNIGKLVGANENFINTVDQAVVSEEDEMAESILSAIKKAGKKALDVVAPGDDELLNRLDKDVHGGKVPNRYNSDSESDEKHPADDELDRILQIMKHRR